MHGRHQPAWDFYSDSMNYVARLQHTFQSGVPKHDLVFYSKLTAYPSSQDSSAYPSNDLVDAGKCFLVRNE